MLLQHSIHLENETYTISERPLLLPPSELVSRVRAYFLTHLAEEITRETLAEHLNLSISSLSHRYRRETGESPMITLQKMRVSLAKILLLKGYPLKNIVPQVGFCNEYYLSKIFKQMEGINPREFRNCIRCPQRETDHHKACIQYDGLLHGYGYRFTRDNGRSSCAARQQSQLQVHRLHCADKCFYR